MSNVEHALMISDKYRPMYPDDIESIGGALRGSLSGTSDTVAAYESALSNWFESQYAVAVSSGAAAISVALAAAGVKRGDEVLLTPTCPLCTVFPVISAGATPVFVDTRRRSFGMDPDDLMAVLNARTRAIIDIPMWGYPTEVDELSRMASDLKLPLILDLAHSHGSTLHGRPMSDYGDMSCFSTHERKLLATGEGGFILTKHRHLADRCRDYSRFGNLNGADFGLNYKLAALPAALGTTRLLQLEDQINVRRRNANYIVQRLTSAHVRERPIVAGGVPNYYFLNLELSFKDNARFIDYLDAKGVPSDIKRYGCRCLYEYPAVAEYKRECPNGTALLKHMTTIPVHPALKTEELDYMVNLINGYLD